MSVNFLNLYTRFERFWHWAQTFLVIALIWTGLEVHGVIRILGFEFAVYWHEILAWVLVVLVVFAIFWHFTTGAWKHYIPTRKHLFAMVHFYLIGIFRNDPHPTRKTELSKLNPLQRVTYLGLKVIVFPLQLLSGFAYYFRNHFESIGSVLPLETIALIHTISTYALIVFIIVHVYLTTTRHTWSSNLKAMLTGREEMPD